MHKKKKDEPCCQSGVQDIIYNDGLIIFNSIVFVLILGMIQLIPFATNSYVPVLLPYYLYPTMMMFGFHHMVNTLQFNEYFIGLHLLFSFYSIFSLCCFLGESNRPAIDLFSGTIAYSGLVGEEAATLNITTVSSEDNPDSSWFVAFQIIAAILILVSLIHVIFAVIALAAQLSINKKEKEHKRLPIYRQMDPRTISMAFCTLGFFFALSQSVIGIILESQSWVILNPSYNANMIFVYCFTAYMVIPLPQHDKSRFPNAAKFATNNPNDFCVMAIGKLDPIKKAVIGMGIIQFVAGFTTSIWGIVQQNLWLYGQTPSMNSFNSSSMNIFLQGDNAFDLECSNTQSLYYSAYTANNEDNILNSTAIANWTVIDSGWSLLYLIIGTCAFISYCFYVNLIINGHNQVIAKQTVDQNGHRRSFESHVYDGIKIIPRGEGEEQKLIS